MTKMRGMILGIISDIHGQLPESVHEAFRHCGAIINAGDTCSESVMRELESIAPTVSVYGNCDRHYDYGKTVHDVARPSFMGVRFYVVHKPEDIPAELPAGTRVVISGHTHVPLRKDENGVLFLNPGSPTDPRDGSRPSVMTVEVDEREVYDVQQIILTPYGPMTENDDAGTRGSNRWESLDGFGFGSEDLSDHMHIDLGELTEF